MFIIQNKQHQFIKIIKLQILFYEIVELIPHRYENKVGVETFKGAKLSPSEFILRLNTECILFNY